MLILRDDLSAVMLSEVEALAGRIVLCSQRKWQIDLALITSCTPNPKSCYVLHKIPFRNIREWQPVRRTPSERPENEAPLCGATIFMSSPQPEAWECHPAWLRLAGFLFVSGNLILGLHKIPFKNLREWQRAYIPFLQYFSGKLTVTFQYKYQTTLSVRK